MHGEQSECKFIFVSSKCSSHFLKQNTARFFSTTNGSLERLDAETHSFRKSLNSSCHSFWVPWKPWTEPRTCVFVETHELNTCKSVYDVKVYHSYNKSRIYVYIHNTQLLQLLHKTIDNAGRPKGRVLATYSEHSPNSEEFQPWSGKPTAKVLLLDSNLSLKTFQNCFMLNKLIQCK